MTTTTPNELPTRFAATEHVHLTSSSSVVADTRVVMLSGDLDQCSVERATRACLDGLGAAVIVDLTELRFMDTAGYRALLGARETIERRGGTLTLVNAVGGPRRLLDLVGSDLRRAA